MVRYTHLHGGNVVSVINLVPNSFFFFCTWQLVLACLFIGGQVLASPKPAKPRITFKTLQPSSTFQSRKSEDVTAPDRATSGLSEDEESSTAAVNDKHSAVKALLETSEKLLLSNSKEEHDDDETKATARQADGWMSPTAVGASSAPSGEDAAVDGGVLAAGPELAAMLADTYRRGSSSGGGNGKDQEPSSSGGGGE